MWDDSLSGQEGIEGGKFPDGTNTEGSSGGTGICDGEERRECGRDVFDSRLLCLGHSVLFCDFVSAHLFGCCSMCGCPVLFAECECVRREQYMIDLSAESEVMGCGPEAERNTR